MSKQTKIWLVTAASFVLIGCIIFGGVMTVLKWDFTKLSTVKFETNSYELNNKFNSIEINIETADINFISSEDGKGKVVCYEEQNEKHVVSVENDTLIINVNNEKKWYEYIGMSFKTPKITVYLPEAQYNELVIIGSTGDIKIPEDFKFENIDIKVSTGDIENYASVLGNIKIKTSTGNICVEKISAGSLDFSVSTGMVRAADVNCQGDITIKVSTGKTNLSNIKCKNLFSGGSTGNISLDNVVANETFSIKRSTGDVKFDRCDAAEIFVKTDTGNIKGSLLTDKVFITQTDTGSIDVPKTVVGGKCEIVTDTGDIKITTE